MDDGLDAIAQLLSLGLVTPAEVAGLRPEELDVLAQLIAQAEARRAHEEMLTLARGLVVLSPFDARGWHAAARALWHLGDEQLAAAAFERAQALESAQHKDAPEGETQDAAPGEMPAPELSATAPANPEGWAAASLPADPTQARVELEHSEAPLFVSSRGTALPNPWARPSWQQDLLDPAISAHAAEEPTQPAAAPPSMSLVEPRREPTVTAVVKRPLPVELTPAPTPTLVEENVAPGPTGHVQEDSFEYVERPQPTERERTVTAVVHRRKKMPLVELLEAALGRDN